MKTIRGLMLMLSLIVAAVLPATAPPGLMNYQGVLRDAAGAPLTGNRDMIFTFYSASSGGDQILLDSHTATGGNAVAVSNGLFTAQFGGGTLADGSGPGTYAGLSNVFKDYGTVYVAITVGGELLTPRIQVIASAYALNADNLDGLNSSDFAAASHPHSGDDIASGSVNQSFIDASVARDSEIMPAVLAGDGAGSTLDADLLDGHDASEFLLTGADHWVDTAGDTMTGTLSMTNTAGPALEAAVNSDFPVISIQNSGYKELLNASNVCTYSVANWHHYGIRTSSTGAKAEGKNIGIFSTAMDSGDENFGGYFAAAGDSGKKYGVYSIASGAGEAYAGYFDGNVTVVNGTTVTTVPSASSAGFNLPHGTAPSSPVNGDLWTTTGGLYAQINGGTVGPFTPAGTHNHDAEYVNITGDIMTGTLSMTNTAGPGLDAAVNSGFPVISLQNSGYSELLNVSNISTLSFPGSYHYGIKTSSSGTKIDGRNIGVYSMAMGSGDGNYGGYFEAAGDTGIKYGIYSTVGGLGENYAGYFHGNVAVSNGKVVTAASTASWAGLNVPHGAAPGAPDDGDLWTTTGGLYARINGATVGPYSSTAYTASNGVTLAGSDFQHADTSGQASSDNSNGFVIQDLSLDAFGHLTGLATVNMDLRFVNITGDTMTGRLTTAASGSVSSGLTLPHGSPPSSPVNGDLWTTTTGVYARINNATVGPLASSSHDHDADYVDVIGDTMTGKLTLANTVGNALDASVNSASTVVSIANAGAGYPLSATTTYAGTTGGLVPAVLGTSSGASTTGANVGVFGSASGSAAENYGGRFAATGSAGKRFGIYGMANGIGENTAGRFEATAPGATVNRALYALASGATTENAAGYFDGNVTVVNGKTTTAASATTRAGLTLPHGSAPTTPVNGDLWTTTGGVYAQISGATVGPFTSALGHTHATLTAGTGLSGGSYSGGAAATFAVSYGTASGTAVQGNQTATITAGNGLSGGTSANALGDGFSASLALGSLTNHWNQTGAFDIQLNNADSQLVMLENGITPPLYYGTLDMGDLANNATYTFSGLSGTVWTTGNDGAGSTLDADLVDGQHGSYFLNTSATTQTKNGKVIFNATTGDFGVQANGSTAGGYFYDFASDSTAYIATADYGVDAYGGTAGGYFTNALGSGYANVGYGNYGIDARGSYSGGHFHDTTTTSYSEIGFANSGIEGHGATAGAYFTENDAGGVAEAWVGRFYNSTEYWGIRAFGATGGGYFADNESNVVGRVGYDTYSFNGTGSKSFIQNHPYDSEKVVVYNAPEGDEVATYTRGSARLVNGEARVKLGATFQWVTNPDIGLTAHLTPRGKWADLYVESSSTQELVVKSRDPNATEVAFDYLVYGLRIGFEEVSVVQNRKEESYIPAMTNHRNLYAAQPDLRAYNALERFKGMRTDMGIADSLDLSRAVALKNAIHEFDPAVDTIPSEYDQEPGTAGVATARTASIPAGGLPQSADIEFSAGPMSDPQPAASPGEPHFAESLVQVDRDLVPSFTVKDAVERGDLLVLNPANGDELFKCFLPADPMVVGIAAEDAPAMRQVRVVQYGTGWVKADATTAPIARGDLLVASPTLGHAMKAVDTKPGTVIGKALEPLQVGTGLIKVLVMLR